MDISLIHAGLAGGVALASLPVILHLFMKQKPKHVVFPALRLIRERQKRSRKKLRVKNWLLLIARMLLVALMALALARPRLYSQTSLGDQNVPMAAAFVFDTSLSMGYQEKDKTRLQEAKERAAEIIKKMTDDSQVFIIDSADARVPESLSPAGAGSLIKGLEIHPSHRPLNAALGQAYTALAGSDRARREAYVLTDLARSAWDLDRKVEGLDKVKKNPAGQAQAKGKATRAEVNDSPINTYVLNLSPKEVHNVTIAEASPVSGISTQGESLQIKAKIRSKGAPTTSRVDFVLDGISRGQKQVTVPANGEEEVIFTTPKLPAGTGQDVGAGAVHQGTIKLNGAPDPLEFDDKRFFTFRVQPQLKVLVVSDLEVDGAFISDAIDPSALPPNVPRTCKVEMMTTSKFSDLGRESIRDYACIFLNNVKELGASDWGKLSVFVHESGGGLVIGLGNLSSPASYNSSIAANLIPATLKEAKEAKADLTFGKVTDLTHPLFQRYSRVLDAQLAHVPIYKYWTVDVPKEGSRTLLAYSDGAPALLERSFRSAKTGRVLLWTTPLARRSDISSPAAWNEFPLPQGDSISFYILMNQAVPYLAGTTDDRLNFEAGVDDAVLPIDPTRRLKNYLVQSADGKTTEKLSPSSTTDSLIVVAPQSIGHWTVTSSSEDGDKVKLGFSVNASLLESEYVPLEAADLDVLFGKDGYKLANDAETLKGVVESVRVGREIFPLLMFLILILVTLENLLANRFYRENTANQAVQPVRAAA
ncbi:BatA domain-containing protein [Singulisphaera sp. PoT]|uniref:BatA domain-containing protein n=1 Tax=Singulisphaera sp. PoT TaxID=3411797 RepID=UPI003BF4F2FE